MSRKTAEHGFSGQLDNFALLDIIQMSCLAQRDGRLVIRNGRRRAEVILSRGRIVHAATKAQVGEEALLEILSWDKGEFQLGSSYRRIHTKPPLLVNCDQVLIVPYHTRTHLHT